MKKIYEGISLEECLKSASREMNTPVDKLGYNILKEKKSFFKKKKIVVEIFESNVKEEVTPSEKKEVVSSGEKAQNFGIDQNNGSIKVVHGEIIVKNPKEDGKPAMIYKSKGMTILVDGVEVEDRCEVFEHSDIKVNFYENEPKRELNIYVSDDRMSAYLEVRYTPKNKYVLKDEEESQKLSFKAEISERVFPPKYTAEEIKEELSNNNVVYGIIEENLGKSVENNKKVLIARGKEPMDGKDDLIESKFKTFSDLEEDQLGNVDFKSIGSVNAVKKGDIIAVRHVGTKGEKGFDVNGRVLKCKNGKQLKLKAGVGCILRDADTVEAAIDGKPGVDGNTYYVHQVHEINGDVDLSTGNVRFIGDVVVHGDIKEGMKVVCGNDLTVDREVERANLTAVGNIIIGGSVVASKICGGGENVRKLNAVEHLKKFSENLTKLTEVVKEIKTYNLLGANKKDGEIIKILLENKFKILLRLSINVIADLNMDSDNNEEDEIVQYIKTKFMGIGPISIKNYLELNELIYKVDNKVEYFEKTLELPVNVSIAYCQDSDIQSSGGVMITGKGEYISDIKASNSIKFIMEGSVARGGTLKAGEEIKCKVVGSTAGVSTKLQVGSEGNIWADIAYHNTIFKVGNRESVLDSPSKNVHAYLKDGLIVVDKFVL